MEDCRIGDLSNNEALDYLKEKRGLGHEAATKLVNFCGSRILLLKDISSSLQAGGNIDGSLPFPFGVVRSN